MRKETGTGKATPSVHLSFPFQQAMRKSLSAGPSALNRQAQNAEKFLRQNQVATPRHGPIRLRVLCYEHVFSKVRYGISSYSLTIWPVSFAPIGLRAEIRANPCVFRLVSYLILSGLASYAVVNTWPFSVL